MVIVRSLTDWPLEGDVKETDTSFIDPLLDKNPITVQILGVCSALAVSGQLETALTMSIAVLFVMTVSSVIISLIRNHIPDSIRLIIQIIIIASMVIAIDLMLQAWFFSISQRLSIFVSLIVTNCLVFGRTESFAMHNPPLASLIDAVGNALGYGSVLLLIAAIRELFGFGTVFGITVLAPVSQQGWFTPVSFLQNSTSAFFLLGVLIWVIRSVRSNQQEPNEYPVKFSRHISQGNKIND